MKMRIQMLYTIISPVETIKHISYCMCIGKYLQKSICMYVRTRISFRQMYHSANVGMNMPCVMKILNETASESMLRVFISIFGLVPIEKITLF